MPFNIPALWGLMLIEENYEMKKVIFYRMREFFILTTILYFINLKCQALLEAYLLCDFWEDFKI